jgi:hypothetical protein
MSWLAKQRWRICIIATLFILAAGLMDTEARRIHQANDSSLVAMVTPEVRQIVADVETRSHWVVPSREVIPSDAHEVGEKNSTVEKVIKRVSQYRPYWLKGWGLPTLLVLTCGGVLLLLV